MTKEITTLHSINETSAIEYVQLEKKSIESIIDGGITNNMPKLREKFCANNQDLNKDNIREILSKEEPEKLINKVYNEDELLFVPLVRMDIFDNFKKCGDKFWDWAIKLTNKYEHKLHSPELDKAVLKGIKADKKFNFDDVVEITEKNASVKSFNVFLELMKKLEEEQSKKPLLPFAKNDEKQNPEEINKKSSQIFEAIGKIINHYLDSQSPELYKNTNPELLERICEKYEQIAKEFPENIKVCGREPMLWSLIGYYVTIYKNSDIDDGKQIEFLKVVNLAFNNTTDKNVRKGILKKYSNNICYIPFDIIQKTFESNEEDDIRSIVKYLEDRYKIEKDEDLKKYNDSIIKNKDLPIELRKQAFLWFFEEIPENEKSDWCKDHLDELINQELPEDIQNKRCYETIFENCYKYAKDSGNKKTIHSYIFRGKNDKLKKIIEGDITSNEEIVEFISKITDEKDIDRGVGRANYLILENESRSSEDLKKISDCFYNLYNDSKEEKTRKAIAEFFVKAIKICDKFGPDKTQFLDRTLDGIKNKKDEFISTVIKTFNEQGDIEFNALMISSYFRNPIPVSTCDYKKYIDYIWEKRKEIQSNTNISNIIDRTFENISGSQHKEVILYALQKGWQDNNAH